MTVKIARSAFMALTAALNRRRSRRRRDGSLPGADGGRHRRWRQGADGGEGGGLSRSRRGQVVWSAEGMVGPGEF